MRHLLILLPLLITIRSTLTHRTDTRDTVRPEYLHSPISHHLTDTALPRHQVSHVSIRALGLYARLLHFADVPVDDIVCLLFLFLFRLKITLQLDFVPLWSFVVLIHDAIVMDAAVIYGTITSVQDLAHIIRRPTSPIPPLPPKSTAQFPWYQNLELDEVVEILGDPDVVLALARTGLRFHLMRFLSTLNLLEMVPLLWLSQEACEPFAALRTLLRRGRYDLVDVLVRDPFLVTRIRAHAANFVAVLQTALDEGRIELFKAAFRQPYASDIVNVGDCVGGMPLLSCALRQRKWTVATVLLTVRNIDIRTSDKWGRTPLDYLSTDPIALSRFLDILKAIRPDLLPDTLTALLEQCTPSRCEDNTKMVRMRLSMEAALSALIEDYITEQNKLVSSSGNVDMFGDTDEWVLIT